jgi:hypothetical protein
MERQETGWHPRIGHHINRPTSLSLSSSSNLHKKPISLLSSLPPAIYFPSHLTAIHQTKEQEQEQTGIDIITNNRPAGCIKEDEIVSAFHTHTT